MSEECCQCGDAEATINCEISPEKPGLKGFQ